MPEAYVEKKVKEHMEEIRDALEEEDYEKAQAHGEEILIITGYFDEVYE
jgi:protein-arginine kinase activator protein McsA